MKTKILFIVFIFLASLSNGQSWQRYMDSINKINYQEHQLMLQQLGIKELRPGPSGNPDAPNAANTDEAKATTYSSLPDPLLFEDGRVVKSSEDWSARRNEILELFDREIYGRVPSNVPSVSWLIERQWDTVQG